MFRPYTVQMRIPANTYQYIEYLLDNGLSIYKANQYLINVVGYNTLDHKIVIFNSARLKSNKIEFISSATNFTEVGFICNATLVKK